MSGLFKVLKKELKNMSEVNYPTDILAGAAVGVLLALFSIGVVEALYAKNENRKLLLR